MNKNNLETILIKIFKKFGLKEDHAKISSNALINAELVGAYGHGLSRLKMYCDRISKKVINPTPKIKIKNISSSISYVDADNSIGFRYAANRFNWCIDENVLFISFCKRKQVSIKLHFTI